MKTIFFILLAFATDLWACSPMPDLRFETCSKQGVVKVHEASATALQQQLQKMQIELDRMVRAVKNSGAEPMIVNSCFNQQFYAMHFADFLRTQKQYAGKVCVEHIQRISQSAPAMANEKTQELRYIAKSPGYTQFLKLAAELRVKIIEFEKYHAAK